MKFPLAMTNINFIKLPLSFGQCIRVNHVATALLGKENSLFRLKVCAAK